MGQSEGEEGTGDGAMEDKQYHNTSGSELLARL